MSKIDPVVARKAQTGPRDLKPPKSPEYAIQTLYTLRRYLEVVKCDKADVDKELAEIIEHEHWSLFDYPSLDDYLDGELGDLADEARTRLTEAKARSQQLAEMVAGSNDVMPAHGEVGNGRSDKSRDRNTNSTQDRSDTATYACRRLKRDRPDLLQRVIDGTLSPHAAMVEAGFRHRTATVKVSAEGFEAAARRHLTEEDRIELAARLMAEYREEEN